MTIEKPNRSTICKGPGYSSGNSFASPIVDGILALMIAHKPGELPRKLVSHLKWCASLKPVPGIIGRVDATKALQ